MENKNTTLIFKFKMISTFCQIPKFCSRSTFYQIPKFWDWSQVFILIRYNQYKKNPDKIGIFYWANYGTWTRDLFLTKEALYRWAKSALNKKITLSIEWFFLSGRRGSNSRHSAWKADALPTELLPQFCFPKLLVNALQT